jgi:hypothetical protein
MKFYLYILKVVKIIITLNMKIICIKKGQIIQFINFIVFTK